MRAFGMVLAGALGLAISAEVLILVADVPLSGRLARFDYQSLDTASNRLFITHMRSDQLIVFNTAHRKEVATIEDMPGATGVWSVPELHRVYVSVTGHHHVAVLDDRTMNVVARVGDIGFPDGIAYAPRQRKIYVSDEKRGDELVIAASTDKVLRSVAVGGEAGNTKYDPISGHVLIAVQTRNDIAVLDPVTDSVVERFTFAGANHPHGMLVDDKHGLLFVANQGNATLSVLDLRTHKVISTHPVGGDPDVLAFDPVRNLLYVAAETGSVSVFAVSGQTVRTIGDLKLAKAHTVAVDPRDGLVYLPLENVNGHPALRIMKPSPTAK